MLFVVDMRLMEELSPCLQSCMLSCHVVMSVWKGSRQGAILNSMHLSNVSSMPTCFHSAVSCIKRSAKSLTPTIVKGLHLLCTLFGPIVLCNFETK